MSDAEIIDLFATDSADRVRAHTATAIQPRRLGVRRAREIATERFAIKAVRGDFTAVADQGDADERTRAELDVVSR